MMELNYRVGADGMRYPELELRPQEDRPLGKYGQMRLTYLKQHKRSTYTLLMMRDNLWQHLLETDDRARSLVEQTVEQMAQQNGVDEKMKEQDQMRWLGMMNSFQQAAEEIALRELVYA